MSSCTGAQANADIAGPGVRISFYIQAVLLSILSCRSKSPDEVTNSLYTLVVSNMAYTITSIVAAAQNGTAEADQNGIALSEAVFVTYLVGLASVGTLMSLISYARFRKDKPDRKVQAAAVAQSYLALSCSIALWVLAPHFGNNVECNNQVLFVIFGSFPVFPAARILSLVVLPIITVVYTASLYYDYFHGSWRRGEKREPLIVPRTTSRSPLPPSENDQQSKKPRTDGSLLIHLVFIVVIFALLILNAELFLIRNFNGSQQKWGFGQVLPMFLISIPLIGVWEAFSKYGLSKHVSAD